LGRHGARSLLGGPLDRAGLTPHVPVLEDAEHEQHENRGDEGELHENHPTLGLRAPGATSTFEHPHSRGPASSRITAACSMVNTSPNSPVMYGRSMRTHTPR